MNPGKMDRQITLQKFTVTQDAYGEPIETWTTLAEVWAQYLPGGGNERFAAQQVFAETEARFLIYWRNDVTPVNRLQFDGKGYDILAVQEIGRREGLELRAKARAE
jgi:SPP1 family predicted phage head-tail adaptor